MLGGAGDRVEKHQEKNQPVEVCGFNGHSTVLPHGVIELAQLVTGGGEGTTMFLNQEKMLHREADVLHHMSNLPEAVGHHLRPEKTRKRKREMNKQF